LKKFSHAGILLMFLFGRQKIGRLELNGGSGPEKALIIRFKSRAIHDK